MGSYENHKRLINQLAEEVESKYDLIRTEFEYYEKGDHTNPVGEIDIAGITENQFDIYEVKTKESFYCKQYGMEQLFRAKNFFENIYEQAQRDVDINLYLKLGDKPTKKIGDKN